MKRCARHSLAATPFLSLVSMLFLGVLVVSAFVAAWGQDSGGASVATGFINKTAMVDGQPRRYVVYVPHDYDPGKPWPLVVFLHGGDERGDDGLKQTEVGIGRSIRLAPERFPCLVLMPQCPRRIFWFGVPSEAIAQYKPDDTVDLLQAAELLGYTEDALLRLMNREADPLKGEKTDQGLRFKISELLPFLKFVAKDQYIDPVLARTLEDYTIDRNRVYLTGLSMGGFGTWLYGARHMDLFAAMIPVSGGGRVEDAHELARVPIWAFHGAEDHLVSPKQTRQMVEAVRNAGGTVRLTEFPDTKHECWDQVYGDPEVMEWLLQQIKAQADRDAGG